MKNRALIGEILLEHGHVLEADIQAALEVQRTSSQKIGQILIRKKCLNEDQLHEALSRQLNIPYQKHLSPEHRFDFPEQVTFQYLSGHSIFPIRYESNVLYVATADPLFVQPLDALAFVFNCPVKPVISSTKEIEKAIFLYFQHRVEMPESVFGASGHDQGPAEFGSADLLNHAHEAPVIKLVNLIITQAVNDRASDIHIEPFAIKLRVRFRIDGILHDKLSPPKEHQEAIASRIKIMSQLNIAENRLPQDAKISLKVAGKDIDIRVSFFPTIFGERIVLRLLNKSDLNFDLRNLGISTENLAQFQNLLRKPHGIILLTGPTGSGKSTTLYAALKTFNTSERNILTIEDPIEYQIDGVGQTQVKPQIGLTFAAGLRAILRQDPDVIMVGEIRDLETAEIAVRAALTGHLVLSTLHTNDAAGAVTRLIDMGIEPYLITSSLRGILAQRLLRLICPYCKDSYKPEPEFLYQLKKSTELVWRGKGCAKCLNTGYLGRVGIFEIITLDEEIRQVILAGGDAGAINAIADRKGLISLRSDAWAKVLQSMTTLDELIRVTYGDL